MGIEKFARDWQTDAVALERDYGIVLAGARAYLPPEFKRNFKGAMDAALALHGLAMDAQPGLTTVGNSAIPAMLTTFIDPDHLNILFAANKGARILGKDGTGEKKKGDWTEMVAMFPVVERTGEVSSYHDYSENGSAGFNMSFPQRQSYHYQTIIQYGEREIAMAAKAQVNLADEKKTSAITVLDKFQNQTYLYGVSGLQNYGILNDPSLPTPIQPGPKAYNAQPHGPWITAGVVTATPNEVYTDIQSLFTQLVTQTNGLIELDQESSLVLVMPPASQVALTAVNSFNVDVFDILKKNFPNMRFETCPQYASAAGNLVQLIAEDVEGQETGYCAFTEKLRGHPLIQKESAWVQKMSQGTWGAIIRQGYAFAQMLGV